MVTKLDYNRIKWGDFLYYDETSPSGLYWRGSNGAAGGVERTAGDVAGGRCNGYFRIGLRGDYYLAHRIVWILNKGYLPNNIVINHKDCTGSNNIIDNLELRSQAENLALNKTAVYKIPRKNSKNLQPYITEQSTHCGKYWSVRVQYRNKNNVLERKSYSYLKYGKEGAWNAARDFLKSATMYSETVDSIKEGIDMKIRVTGCSDSLFWYSKKVGEVYQVRRIDKDCYWVRPETDAYSGWNFVLISDCESVGHD